MRPAMFVTMKLERLAGRDTRDPAKRLFLQAVLGIDIAKIHCTVPMTTTERESPADEYPFTLEAVRHKAKDVQAVVEVEREFAAQDLSLDLCPTGGVAIEVGGWLRVSFPDRKSAHTFFRGIARALAALVPKEERS